MANQKTDKCPYLSNYGGGYIRADQWVTEKLCAVIAKKEGCELPDKFWNFPKWQKLFRRQVQMASSLLLIYDVHAVAAALRDKRLYNVRSFGAFSSVKFFSSVLEEYQSKHDVEISEFKSAKNELQTRGTTVMPKRITKDNKLSRLKNIDVETRPVQSG